MSYECWTQTARSSDANFSILSVLGLKHYNPSVCSLVAPVADSRKILSGVYAVAVTGLRKPTSFIDHSCTESVSVHYINPLAFISYIRPL